MQTCINGHVLIDTVSTVRVVVSFLSLDERKSVWSISVYLIRACETERRVAAKVAGGHKHIDGSGSVDIEIIVRYGGRLVVRRLSRSVDDEIGSLTFK